MTSRGQTLVLGALTMLLVALMVFITLGISVRIHERQEMQLVADAAAYSQAVATARAFNAVSAENRVLVAQMSSIAAAQSMLSYVGYYHGVLNQARDALAHLADQNVCGKEFRVAMDRIMHEDERLIQTFEQSHQRCGYIGIKGYDALSAEYVRTDLYGTALDIADDQRKLYGDMMMRLPDIATDIARAANASNPFGESEEEFRVETAGNVTEDERGRAVRRHQQDPIDMVRATMATRGQDPFVSSRGDNLRTPGVSGAEFIRRRIVSVIQLPMLTVSVTDFGTSYFGNDGPQRGFGARSAEEEGFDGSLLVGQKWLKWKQVARVDDLPITGAWAQDSGRFSFAWPSPPAGCTLRVAGEDAFGYLVTTGPHDHRDNHMWRRGDKEPYHDYREWDDEWGHVKRECWPEPRHSFKKKPRFARNDTDIWPVFTDYETDRLDEGRASQVDAFGQPKTMVAIRRDYAARAGISQRPDPWELSFRIGFPSTEPGIDLTTQRAKLKRALVLSSGFVYYHRKEHFREPPNFLNPFWRATLTASDVDERFKNRGASALKTLGDFRERRSAQVLEDLIAKGYEAVP